ncbi:MAG: hypothetical protein AAFX40_07260 [Cyanobacteria bacterium J06639_1]
MSAIDFEDCYLSGQDYHLSAEILDMYGFDDRSDRAWMAAVAESRSSCWKAALRTMRLEFLMMLALETEDEPGDRACNSFAMPRAWQCPPDVRTSIEQMRTLNYYQQGVNLALMETRTNLETLARTYPCG